MTFRIPALLLLALGVLAVPAPAQAAACSGSSGVTVVVQFGDGPTQVGCAAGDPDTGYAALTSAGFTIILAQGSGAGALCRINGYPGGSNCGAMPPANAYWAYFHAKRGGSWSYSSTGGGGYDPKPGSVEGWRFKGDAHNPPDLEPPAAVVVAPPSPPEPTARPTKKPAAVTSQTTTKTTTNATAATPTVATTPTASPPTSAAPSPTGPAASAPVEPTPGYAAAPASVVDRDDAGNAGLSWVWGVVLVAVLVTAGAATAVIRRRT